MRANHSHVLSDGVQFELLKYACVRLYMFTVILRLHTYVRLAVHVFNKSESYKRRFYIFKFQIRFCTNVAIFSTSSTRLSRRFKAALIPIDL